MPSIDKVALTCKLLLDARVLEQRREIELMKVQLFLKDYHNGVFGQAMRHANEQCVKCNCSGCKATGRAKYIRGGPNAHAQCAFGPWLDARMIKFGFVCARQFTEVTQEESSEGPFQMNLCNWNFSFTAMDCHFLETPSGSGSGVLSDPKERWVCLYIGKKFWDVKSIHDPVLAKMEKFMQFLYYGCDE